MKTLTKLALFSFSLFLAGFNAHAGGQGSQRPTFKKIVRPQAAVVVARPVPPRQFQPVRRTQPFTPVGGQAVRRQNRGQLTTVVTGAIPTRPVRAVILTQPGVVNSTTRLVPGAGVVRQPAIICPQINTLVVPQTPILGGNCPGVFGGGICPTPRVSVTLIENLTATEADLQEAADLLRDAYVTLSKAAHVYKGRRVWAMIQTSRAGAILGIRLAGDGHGNLPRSQSDQLLRDAKAILERVHPILVNKSRPGAAQHVQNAINHLTAALAQP